MLYYLFGNYVMIQIIASFSLRNEQLNIYRSNFVLYLCKSLQTFICFIPCWFYFNATFFIALDKSQFTESIADSIIPRQGSSLVKVIRIGEKTTIRHGKRIRYCYLSIFYVASPSFGCFLFWAFETDFSLDACDRNDNKLLEVSCFPKPFSFAK